MTSYMDKKSSNNINESILNKNMLTTLINNGDIDKLYNLIDRRNFDDDALQAALFTFVINVDKFDKDDAAKITQLIYSKIKDKSYINTFLTPDVKAAEDELLSQSGNLESLAGADLNNIVEANEEAIETLGKALGSNDIDMVADLLYNYHYEPKLIDNNIKNAKILGNTEILSMLIDYNANNKAT